MQNPNASKEPPQPIKTDSTEPGKELIKRRTHVTVGENRRKAENQRKFWSIVSSVALIASYFLVAKYDEAKSFVHGIFNPLKETAAVPAEVLDITPEDFETTESLTPTNPALTPDFDVSPTPSYTPTPQVSVTPEAVTKEAFDYFTPTIIKTEYDLSHEVENFHIVPVKRDVIFTYGKDRMIIKVRAKDWHNYEDAGKYYALYTYPSMSEDADAPSYSIGRKDSEGYWIHIIPTSPAKKTDKGNYLKHDLNGYYIPNTWNDIITFNGNGEGYFQGYDTNPNKSTKQREIVRDDPKENYQLFSLTFYENIDPIAPTPTVTPQDQSRNHLNNFRAGLRKSWQRRSGSGIF